MNLNAGTATFLFTEIEGSVRLWEADRDAMATGAARHDGIVREQVAAAGGQVFKTVGESHRAVFADPVAALSSAVAIQRAVGAEAWPSGLPIRVCMALHSGACTERDGDYVGPVVNRAARLLDVGHGGQVLVTAATYALLVDRLPGGIALWDLGEQRLRDLGRGERVFQVTGPGLAEEFAVLRSLDDPRLGHNLPSQATNFVGRAAELAELRALVSGGPRLVTIAGPGGIGKSRLALQVAADVLDGSGDGVWLVELAPVAEPELVARAAAAALGVPEAPGRPMLETLIEAVGDRDLLLVLDNAEHVLGAVAELADAVVRSCPRALPARHQQRAAWRQRGARLPGSRPGGPARRSRRVRTGWPPSSRCNYSPSTPRCTGAASLSTTATRRRWRRSALGWTGFRWPSSSPRPVSARCRCRRSTPASIIGSGC